MPSKDACWWKTDNLAGYARTRAQAWSAIRGWACGPRGGPKLLGLDFALGFPAGTAAALGVHGWRGVFDLLAAEVEDDADTQVNNRWSVAARLNERAGVGPGGGPWWGCPPASASPWLTSRRGFGWPVAVPGAGGPLPRMRRTDAACTGVQEVWKLLGAGSVGSQTLLGVAGLVRLERTLAADGVRLRVWPFERDDEPAAEELWVAECWPGLVDAEVRQRGGMRDLAQVTEWVSWARDHAAGRWHDPLPPEADEEGWILGV